MKVGNLPTAADDHPDGNHHARQPGEVGDHRAGVDVLETVQAQHRHGRCERAGQGNDHCGVSLPRKVSEWMIATPATPLATQTRSIQAVGRRTWIHASRTIQSG